MLYASPQLVNHPEQVDDALLALAEEVEAALGEAAPVVHGGIYRRGPGCPYRGSLTVLNGCDFTGPTSLVSGPSTRTLRSGAEEEQ